MQASAWCEGVTDTRGHRQVFPRGGGSVPGLGPRRGNFPHPSARTAPIPTVPSLPLPPSQQAAIKDKYLLTPRPQRRRGTVRAGFPELPEFAPSPPDPLFPPSRPRPALHPETHPEPPIIPLWLFLPLIPPWLFLPLIPR